jgi:PAS domain S-box-containing protein
MTGPQDGHKAILLVEDEAVTAVAEKRVLEKHGYLVLVVPSGEKAIEAVKSHERIDLILMDVNLGAGMDGTEAAEIILSERDIPVIFLSNHTQRDVVEKTDRIASYGYVVKNSGEAVLIASVNMAFRLHEANRELKKREQALKESEQRFRSLFETSADSILLVNQETDQVLGANPAACRLYGYSLEEFLALKITDVSAEPEKTEAAVRQSVPEVPFRLHRKKDGTAFPVEIRGGYFAEGDLRLKTAFIRDITDRKKAEEQLLIANFALQSSISAIGMANLDGRVAYVNDSFLRLWGYERADEVLGRHISEFAMAGREEEGIKASVLRGGYIGEDRARRKDGSPFYVQVAVNMVRTDEGKPICTMASFIDITERKQAEDKLLTSQLQLAEAADLARIAYWEYDEATSACIFNDGFYDLFGTTAEREGGYRMTREEHLRRFVHPDDREDLRRHVDETRVHPRTGGIERYEHRAIRGDGEVIHILTRNRVVLDSGGRVLKIVGVNQDITGRKKTEKALRRSETKFRTLYDSSSDAVMLADEKGFLDCNKKALALYGCASVEEFSSQHPADLSPPQQPCGTDSLTLASRMIAEAMEKGSARFEWVHERKDTGATFPADVLLTAMELDGKRVFQAVVRDITEHKRMEEEILERRRFVEKILETTPTLIYIYDSAAGNVYANHEILDFLGYTPEQVQTLGPSLFQHILHPDDAARVAQHHGRFGSASEGEVFDIEYRMKGANGEWRWLRSSDVLFRRGKDGVAQQILGSCEDITERKHAEDALRESETKLRAILEASRDAIGVSKEGIRIFVNPAYASLFGYESADELIGKSIFDALAPESREFVEEVVAKHARGESVPSFYEESVLRKDGTPFLVEVSASTFASKGEHFTLGILRDITERKKAEEEVTLLKHSIDVHYDGAYWLDSDNRFVYVNDAACKSLGYEREELIGRTIFDITPTRTPQAMRGVWDGLRKGGSFLRESVHRRKDGSEFPVEVLVTYVEFRGKEYACGFARDITEKQHLEDQLRQAQKMEAVGTLVGGVAHDFNNILTVIMGLGNLMQMEIDKDDIHRAYIDQIVASSERAADLTRSLLAFSRKQRITLEPHKVNGVVTSTAKLLTRLLPEDISLSMDLTGKDTSSLLDVSQIGQVLMNLATNARDAMPHGGSLTITTDRAKIDKNFTKTHGFGRTGEYVRLSVSDTGIGIDDSTMKRIFEPFFTTKEVGKGTGLGLASAYGVVKQHNGYVTVSSIPFKGTTFDIYLPFFKTPSRRKARAQGGIKGGAETILIVEDDRDVRNMLTKILSGQGYTTIEAVDGEDAIKTHQEHGEHIDLIILDVVMPGRNGKETLDEITRADPLAKAIFVSGYTGEGVIDKGIHRESVDFLQKPLTIQALLAKVREVLDR